MIITKNEECCLHSGREWKAAGEVASSDLQDASHVLFLILGGGYMDVGF